ncbi:MAG TPA: hypothetical protein VMQ76_04685 [Terracidiphilus sp.]|jgi:hypothetical protein|nr:hypothetical protein [Terracidiphilus sp.]
MSVEKVEKIFSKCVCERPDCPGKGKPWYFKGGELPDRCHWCKRIKWWGIDLSLEERNKVRQQYIQDVVKIVNKCVCEHDDCPGQGKPWYSKNEAIPARCHWCNRTSWNGVDRRLLSQKSIWVRVQQCTVCGGTEWATDEAGESVCVHCTKSASPRLKPKERKIVPAAHAPGCTCALCRKKRAKKPAAAIALPKPKRVRNPE